MKKFTSLLIGLSLALAGAAFAQQTEESPAAGGKKGKEKTTEQAEPKAPKTQGATGEQGAGAEKVHKGKGANANAPGATMNEQGATGAEQGKGKGKGREKSATGAGTETGVSGQTGAATTTETGAGKGKGKGREKSMTGAGTESATGASGQTGTGAATEAGAGKGKGKGRGKVETSAATGATGTNASAEAGASASVAPTGKTVREKGMKAGAGANAKPSGMSPATAASASAAPTVAATSATGQQNAGANVAATGGTTAHVEKQKVEQVKQQTAQIKQQHVNFKAQPRPDKVPPVTFNVSYRIEGSERWQGPRYEVFRSYHPERHERNWYHSHFTRIELIGGGYYYWNNGYWFPAWGYDPSAEYYAYDAPIYVGHHSLPPDRVIADVQAELQEMGYYRGEVDGLLGPLTREALTAYQEDQGLTPTAVIDEPTLDSLGMS